MNVLKWLTRGILLSAASALITLWLAVATLNMTLFNRTTVLSWLDSSGAYNHIVDSLISMQASETQDSLISADVVKQAVSKTLSAQFIKESSEKILNAAYDWGQSKTETINFSIALAEKRDELQKQLAIAIKPQLAGLPVCSSSFGTLPNQQTPQCLPRGASPAKAADDLAKQAINSSDFLKQPITAESLQINTSQLNWIRTAVHNSAWLSIVLPIVAILLIAGYVLLSSTWVKGVRSAAGRIFFGTTFATAAGVALWLFGGSIHLADPSSGAAQIGLVSNVIEPIVHQAAPSIGMWLTLFAGSIWLAAGTTWAIVLVLHHRKKELEVTDNPVDSLIPETNSSPKPVDPVAPKPQIKQEATKTPPKNVGRM